MSDVYTVIAFDINTNTRICELPANGLTFGSRLNDAGAAQFTVDLLDPGAAQQVAPFLAYDGKPVHLVVDRDGVIVWSGWAKTGKYQHAAHTLSVGGKEWLDYFTQRVIVADYSNVTYPNGLAPPTLIQKAVTDAQNVTIAGPGASIGMGVTVSASGMPYIVPSYTLSQRTFVSQVIADMVAGLTPGTGGVDVNVQAVWGSNGTPVLTLQVVSPRVGRPAGFTGLVFDLLGAIDHTWPTDIGLSGTTLFESGGGTGITAPAVVVQAPGVPVGGLGQMPRLDKVVQHANIRNRPQLAVIAGGEAQTYGGPVRTPTVTIATADRTNPLGSWVVGDDARLVAEPYERQPNGLDEYWRIVQHQVTVPDAGKPVVTLTFNPPPQY